MRRLVTPQTAERRPLFARFIVLCSLSLVGLVGVAGCQADDTQEDDWQLHCEVDSDCGGGRCIEGQCQDDGRDGGRSDATIACNAMAIPCCDLETGAFVENRQCDITTGEHYCPPGTAQYTCRDGGDSPDIGPVEDVWTPPEDDGGTPTPPEPPTYPDAPGQDGSTAGMPTAPVGNDVSVVSDGQGVLHVAMITTDGEVHYAQFEPNGWTTERVASGIASSERVIVMGVSIALTEQGEPVVAYLRDDADGSRVMLARRTGAGSWDSELVANEANREYRFVELQHHDGAPIVAWYGDELVEIATPGSAGWSVAQVAAAELQPWGGLGFVVDTNGVGHFTYCANEATQAVRYATYDLAAEQAASELVRKAYASCSGADVALDSSQAPRIVGGVDSDILYFELGAAGWQETPVHEEGYEEQFTYPQLTFDSTDTAHVFYGNISRAGTHYARATGEGWERFLVNRESEALHADAAVTPDDVVHLLYETQFENSGPVGYWHTE